MLETLCPVVSSFSCFTNINLSAGKPQESSLSQGKLHEVRVAQCPAILDKIYHNLSSRMEDEEQDEMNFVNPHVPVPLVFDNVRFYLDESGLQLDRKKFKNLTDNIIENGGTCLKYLNNNVNFFITGPGSLKSRLSVFSQKQKAALKLNIPLVTIDFVNESIKEKKLLQSETFSLINASKSEDFQLGEITLMEKNEKSKPSYRSFKNVSGNEYTPGDLDNFILLKYVQLKGKTTSGNAHDSSLNYQFYILEIHASIVDDYDIPNKFCVFSHEGEIKLLENGKRLCRYVSTTQEALDIYGSLLKQMTGAPKYLTYTQEYLSNSLGSPSFQEIQHELHSNYVASEPSVIHAIHTLWSESYSSLADVLAIDPLKIPSWKIKLAEKVIKQIGLLLKSGKNDSLTRLSDEFYKVIDLKKEHREPLSTFAILNDKYILVKKLQDLITLEETSPVDIEHTPEARVKALSCNITEISENMDNYEDICNLVLNSQTENTNIKIHNIFKISRNAESILFFESLGNKKHLFHGTSPDNLLGIISRGMQVQNSFDTEMNMKEQFHHLLGPGIYFTDSTSYCTKYCKPNRVCRTRMLLVCEVSLGKVYKTSESDPKMTAPPSGYNSVLGDKNIQGSEFYENEYVIFDQCQTRLEYLVEYSLPEDKAIPKDISSLSKKNNTKAISTANEGPTSYSFDITNINVDSEPIVEPPKGLECVNPFDNIHLSLKSVHIKAQIVDLVAKVYLFQEYRNDSDKHLEVKYVFPLDKGAAICGFEAFIGAKHIIGEVKEKETARHEYETAKKEGHGAYLLEGTSQNIFSIQIGNLPPKTRAIIKISFIAELNIENDSVEFIMPSLYQRSAFVEESHDVKPNFSFQASIEMAREILSINSPSHEVVSKKTDTKAVLKLLPIGQNTLSDLKLYIRVQEINVPRMWIEKHPDRDTRACMVTFYPKFKLEGESNGNTILFLLDASDSMKPHDFQNLIYIVLLSLELMKPNVLFNIVAYGTIHRELFFDAQPFSLENHSKAKQFLLNLRPNFGKNQLSPTLRSYQLLLLNKKHDVFLVTNTIRNEEFDILKLNLKKMRVFSFGLGKCTDHHLLSLLAHKTGGSHVSCNSIEKDKWKWQIRDALRKSRQPSLTNIEIEWQNETNVMQAPIKLYSLFNGSSKIIYALDTFCTMATLKAKIDEQKVSTVVASYELSQTTGTLLHSLAARAYVKDWEDGILNENEIMHLVSKEERKETITNLAKEYSLVTSLTSFVAVEKRSDRNESFLDINIESFLDKVDIDILNYMEFSVHKGEKGDQVEESHVLSPLYFQNSSKFISSDEDGSLECALTTESSSDDLSTSESCSDDGEPIPVVSDSVPRNLKVFQAFRQPPLVSHSVNKQERFRCQRRSRSRSRSRGLSLSRSNSDTSLLDEYETNYPKLGTEQAKIKNPEKLSEAEFQKLPIMKKKVAGNEMFFCDSDSLNTAEETMKHSSSNVCLNSPTYSPMRASMPLRSLKLATPALMRACGGPPPLPPPLPLPLPPPPPPGFAAPTLLSIVPPEPPSAISAPLFGFGGNLISKRIPSERFHKTMEVSKISSYDRPNSFNNTALPTSTVFGAAVTGGSTNNSILPSSTGFSFGAAYPTESGTILEQSLPSTAGFSFGSAHPTSLTSKPTTLLATGFTNHSAVKPYSPGATGFSFAGAYLTDSTSAYLTDSTIKPTPPGATAYSLGAPHSIEATPIQATGYCRRFTTVNDQPTDLSWAPTFDSAIEKTPSMSNKFTLLEVEKLHELANSSAGIIRQQNSQLDRICCEAEQTYEDKLISDKRKDFNGQNLKKKKKKKALDKVQIIQNEIYEDEAADDSNPEEEATLTPSCIMEILANFNSEVHLTLTLAEKMQETTDLNNAITFMENNLKPRGGSFPIIRSLLDCLYADLRKEGVILEDLFSCRDDTSSVETTSEHPLFKCFANFIISMETELRNNGLISLGSHIVEMVLNMLVKVSLIEINLLYLLVKFSEENSEILMELESSFPKVIESLSAMLQGGDGDISISEDFVRSILDVIKEFDKKYPMLYTVLTRGKSWEDFIFSHLKKMLILI